VQFTKDVMNVKNTKRDLKKRDFYAEALPYLKEGLKELKINLSPETQSRLLIFLEELSAFAEPLGLTSLKTPKDLVVKHLLDSLTILDFLPENEPILDLGTGGGLPGMVIKIVRPEQEVWLVDARKRPISFLHYIVGKLSLTEVKILQTTVGEGDPLPRRYFAVVVSRAVCSLDKLWELSSPLLRKEGVLLAMKGPRVEEEIEILNKKFPELRVQRYNFCLPLTGDHRVIVKINPN